MRLFFCPRLSKRRAFLALLGALPAAHGGLGQTRGQADAPAPDRATVLGAGNRAVSRARRSDDTNGASLSASLF
jgi:hypothetical protein